MKNYTIYFKQESNTNYSVYPIKYQDESKAIEEATKLLKNNKNVESVKIDFDNSCTVWEMVQTEC